MANWGFWEWLTYGCIAVAAIILALDAAVKQSPDLNTRFGANLANRTWAFTPFALILVSAVVIAIRHIPPSHETPIVPPLVPAQHVDGGQRQSAVPITPPPIIDVGGLANSERARQLHVMNNDDLASEAQAIAIQITDLRRKYSNQQVELNFNTRLSAIVRVKKKADLERGLDSEFRSRFANDTLLLQSELSKRAAAMGIELYDIGAIKITQTPLSDNTIGWIGTYLDNWALQLKNPPKR
jgi:hypothetical protein